MISVSRSSIVLYIQYSIKFEIETKTKVFMSKLQIGNEHVQTRRARVYSITNR